MWSCSRTASSTRDRSQQPFRKSPLHWVAGDLAGDHRKVDDSVSDALGRSIGDNRASLNRNSGGGRRRLRAFDECRRKPFL